MDRRACVKSLLMGSASLCGGCSSVRRVAARPAPTGPRAIPLGADTCHALALAAECLFPADRVSPGALELGIEDYLAAQLTTPYYRRHVPVLTTLVGALDRACDRSFITAGQAERFGVVHRMAEGDLSTAEFDSRQACSVLLDITLEGCFADPKYGGNRSRLAWQTIAAPSLNMRWWGDCGCH